ncbi:unnamed protein product [Caretta caretta]
MGLGYGQEAEEPGDGLEGTCAALSSGLMAEALDQRSGDVWATPCPDGASHSLPSGPRSHPASVLPGWTASPLCLCSADLGASGCSHDQRASTGNGQRMGVQRSFPGLNWEHWLGSRLLAWQSPLEKIFQGKMGPFCNQILCGVSEERPDWVRPKVHLGQCPGF